MGMSVEEQVAAAQSDAEATERASMEAAIQASREQFDCQYENLEASLIASLERQSTQEQEAKDVSEAKARSELVETQNEMLKSIQKQSESEFGMDEDEQLQRAIAASKSTNSAAEEEELKKALEMSMDAEPMSGITEDAMQEDDLQRALKMSAALDGGHIIPDLPSEEEQMRKALEASMGMSGGAGVGGPSVTVVLYRVLFCAPRMPSASIWTAQYLAFGWPVSQSSEATAGSLSGQGPETSWSAPTYFHCFSARRP